MNPLNYKNEAVLQDNPLSLKHLDIERAVFCAEHFDECSIDEMNSIVPGKHKENLILTTIDFDTN